MRLYDFERIITHENLKIYEKSKKSIDANSSIDVYKRQTLYRYTAAKVNIDGKEYKLDESYGEEGSNVVSTVYDGRTNTQIKLSDGQSTVIKFENGAALTVKAEGQTYTATLGGKAPTELQTGPD